MQRSVLIQPRTGLQKKRQIGISKRPPRVLRGRRAQAQLHFDGSVLGCIEKKPSASNLITRSPLDENCPLVHSKPRMFEESVIGCMSGEKRLNRKNENGNEHRSFPSFNRSILGRLFQSFNFLGGCFSFSDQSFNFCSVPLNEKIPGIGE